MMNNIVYSLLCLSQRDDFGEDYQGFFRFWVRTVLLPDVACGTEDWKLNSIYAELLQG